MVRETGHQKLLMEEVVDGIRRKGRFDGPALCRMCSVGQQERRIENRDRQPPLETALTDGRTCIYILGIRHEI